MDLSVFARTPNLFGKYILDSDETTGPFDYSGYRLYRKYCFYTIPSMHKYYGPIELKTEIINKVKNYSHLTYVSNSYSDYFIDMPPNGTIRYLYDYRMMKHLHQELNKEIFCAFYAPKRINYLVETFYEGDFEAFFATR
jgi:hypothetical protein